MTTEVAAELQPYFDGLHGSFMFQDRRGAGSKHYGQTVCEFWTGDTEEGPREGVNWGRRSVSGHRATWNEWLATPEPRTRADKTKRHLVWLKYWNVLLIRKGLSCSPPNPPLGNIVSVCTGRVFHNDADFCILSLSCIAVHWSTQMCTKKDLRRDICYCISF